MKKVVGLTVFTLMAALVANAGVISVNLTNVDGPRQVPATGSTGVINTDGWVNFNTAASLTTNNVAGSAVDVVASKATGNLNTARDAGGDVNGQAFLSLYEAGLRDSSISTKGDTYFTISDMTAYLAAEGDTSYNLIVYYKSAGGAWNPDGIALGLTTAALTTVDPDGASISVNDSFVEAANAESNYIIFSGLTADSTTVYLNKVNRDGLLTGFQIQTIPEPATLGIVAAFGGGIVFIRRRLMM